MERSVVFLLSLLSVFILTVSVEAFTNGERYVILTENLVGKTFYAQLCLYSCKIVLIVMRIYVTKRSSKFGRQ